MRRAPFAFVKPQEKPDAQGRGARHEGGQAVKADRNAAASVSDRHGTADALRWVVSTILALGVVVLLLLAGQLL